MIRRWNRSWDANRAVSYYGKKEKGVSCQMIPRQKLGDVYEVWQLILLKQWIIRPDARQLVLLLLLCSPVCSCLAQVGFSDSSGQECIPGLVGHGCDLSSPRLPETDNVACNPSLEAHGPARNAPDSLGSFLYMAQAVQLGTWRGAQISHTLATGESGEDHLEHATKTSRQGQGALENKHSTSLPLPESSSPVPPGPLSKSFPPHDRRRPD